MKLFRTFLLASAVLSGAVAAAQSVSYQGSTLSWDDDRPYNAGGTIMLPARDTMDRVGGLLERNESGMRIDLLWNSNRAVFRQGDRFFMMGGKRYNLPTSSQARGGTLYLPLEIFAKVTNGGLKRGGGGGGGGGDKPDQGNQIFFDGERVRLEGWQKPYRKDGVLMVPFRAFGDAIGAQTDRSDNGKTVSIKFQGDRVVYQKGAMTYLYNDKRIELSTNSEDYKGTLFVPITIYRSVTGGRITLSQQNILGGRGN